MTAKQTKLTKRIIATKRRELQHLHKGWEITHDGHSWMAEMSGCIGQITLLHKGSCGLSVAIYACEVLLGLDGTNIIAEIDK